MITTKAKGFKQTCFLLEWTSLSLKITVSDDLMGLNDLTSLEVTLFVLLH